MMDGTRYDSSIIYIPLEVVVEGALAVQPTRRIELALPITPKHRICLTRTGLTVRQDTQVDSPQYVTYPPLYTLEYLNLLAVLSLRIVKSIHIRTNSLINHYAFILYVF
jgi:hypothetical protein